MKIFQYKCTLLSDIVIASSSATEGFNRSLDYIPGAKFLGIVAGKLYDIKDKTKTLDLFHNAEVRFGDAHPYFEGKVGLQVPFKWFYPKGEDLTKKIYLHAEDLSNEVWKKEQPKQARVGYFIPTGENTGKLLKIDQDFSIKSAYDSKKMKAKDAQMFGYFSLKKGTEWVFVVEDLTGKYGNEIKELLVGKKRIGKSRSAEYGLVQIDFDKEVEKVGNDIIQEDTAFLYAKSNLCFYDSFGRNTTRPLPSQLSLPKGSSILWEKSQIRTRVYQVWNRKRANRDADRMIVEKGSVFAVRLGGDIHRSQIENGVGAHQNEGFGKLLINPYFLQSKTAELRFSLSKMKTEDWKSQVINFEIEESKQDKVVLAYLAQRKKAAEQIFDIDKKVNEFIENNMEFKGISHSQWGLVRNYAKYSANIYTFENLLFSEESGHLHQGQSEKEWRKNGRREKLYEYLFKKDLPKSYIIPFTIKLAAQMAKTKS